MEPKNHDAQSDFAHDLARLKGALARNPLIVFAALAVIGALAFLLTTG